MGHHRWLSKGHPWRRDKSNFDGKVEKESAPKSFSGTDILRQWDGYENVVFGKTPKEAVGNIQEHEHELPIGWKKKSIFFDLPYWKTVLIRNNLDVMHIEKNVLDNIINTLLNKDGKTKDNIGARLDLEILNIRESLYPKKMPNGKVLLPQASYVLTPQEKEIFLTVLKDLKVPDGFSSNISRRIQVRERKILGLKSHDCHVLMQQLLPLAVRASMRKSVQKPIGLVLNEFCTFFRELCSKVIDVDAMKKMESTIPLILCKLERIFPPAFFDIMVHLTIHLATEARIAGPVQYRWMYPIERLVGIIFLYTLVSYPLD